MSYESNYKSMNVDEEQLIALCVDKLSSYLGVKINIVEGGPSAADPQGLFKKYIGFRDRYDNGIALAITQTGNLLLLNEVYRGN